MGYEATPEQRYEHEIVLLPEASAPYAEFGHEELIGLFYKEKGDPRIGEELSLRLFSHAGVTTDPRSVPLVGLSGEQVRVGDYPLMLSDYVNYAALNHRRAVPNILGFLMQEPGTPEYEATQRTVWDRLNAGRR